MPIEESELNRRKWWRKSKKQSTCVCMGPHL